jgi:hypothetical protein
MTFASLGRFLLFFGLTSMSSLSATNFEENFRRLFPQPQVLSEALFRADEGSAYLSNISEVRDLKGNGGDKYWKAHEPSLFRCSYFSQPFAGGSIEYWVRTLAKPTRQKKNGGSDFDNGNIMRIQELTSFAMIGATRDLLEIRHLSFSGAYYYRCQALRTQPKNIAEHSVEPLACTFVDRQFCAKNPAPLTPELILASSLAHKERMRETVLSHFASSYTVPGPPQTSRIRWVDVDPFFRGNKEAFPTLTESPSTKEFSSVEVKRFEDACRLLLDSDPLSGRAGKLSNH